MFWAPLAGVYELPLELSSGKNTVTIYATDDQGLERRSLHRIWGEFETKTDDATP